MKTSRLHLSPTSRRLTLRASGSTLAAAAASCFLTFTPLASAITYYWDTNGDVAGSGNATGTWDSSVSAFFTQSAGGTTATTANTTTTADTLTFSAGNGGASVAQQNGTPGTITVSGNQSIGTMTLNQSDLILTGGNITVGTLVANANATISSRLVNNTNIRFDTAGRTLTLSGGGSNHRNITGNDATIAAASTLSLTAGTYTTEQNQNTQYNIGNITTETGGVVINNGATLSQPLGTASFQIGNAREGLMIVNTGGNLTITPAANLLIGRGAGNGGKLLVSGGNVTSGGAVAIGFNMTANSTNTLTVSGGSLTGSNDIGIGVQTTSAAAGSMNAILNISGGIVTTGAASGIKFGSSGSLTASSVGNGTLNMTGGALYVGTAGISRTGTGSYTIGGINLSGGTIGALGNWTSNLNMNLGTTNGAITFQSGNQTGTSFNITLSGNLTGSGGLTKTGSGNLTLSGAANAYGGNTTVTAGTLFISGSGNIGNSNLKMNGGVFDITGATTGLTLASSQSLTGNGTIVTTGKTFLVDGTLSPGNSPGLLSITGNMTIGANATTTMELAGSGGVKGTDFDNIAVSETLTYDGDLSIVSFGGFSLDTVGSYDLFDGTMAGNFASITVGATSLIHDSGVWTGNNGVSTYTFTNGTGVLDIAVIPEPSTALLLGAGLAGLAVLRRRRKSA